MKTFQYSEQNTQKSILFITLYLGAWLTGAITYFGGFLELANAVENIGSAKSTGLIVGILVIGPFFFLMKFVYTKVTVVVDQEKLVIEKKGKENETIPFSAIDSMIINAARMNTLHLYGKNGTVLWTLLPMISSAKLVEEIPDLIAQTITFKKEQSTRKFLNTQYVATTYHR